MAQIEMAMPRMGESVMEATILNWLVKEGDTIEAEEPVVEVATDKVDTEVMSTHSGTIVKILAAEGDVIEVGKPIILIESETEENSKDLPESSSPTPAASVQEEIRQKPLLSNDEGEEAAKSIEESSWMPDSMVQLLTEPAEGRFYSPLVSTIAREEGISSDELNRIPGSGQGGRVTKKDILEYVKQKQQAGTSQNNGGKEDSLQTARQVAQPEPVAQVAAGSQHKKSQTSSSSARSGSVATPVSFSGEHEIIEMDRMRRMIADRMQESLRVSAHVTTFVEADMTNIVHWRRNMKQEFMKKEGEPLTFTPIFIEAIAKALKEFPLINASVQGHNLIVKKDINVGVAVALENNNLIVPVIHNADQLSLIGITKKLNTIVRQARKGKLNPDQLSGGTYTMSNVGTFGNVSGTPIIMQPQVAIMAFGTIVKKPAVIETPQGDTLGIRQKMFLSHSYDHRVVDGALGGRFVRYVADLLEGFAADRKLW